MDGMSVPPTNSFVETLISDVIVFEGLAFGSSSELDEVMRIEPPGGEGYSYKMRYKTSLSLHAHTKEGHVRIYPERGPSTRTRLCWHLDL